jgi:hypothetical protein
MIALRTSFVLALALIPLTGAYADTFDIKGLAYTKGRMSVEANTSYFNGYPANAETLRASIDPAVNYAVSDHWQATLRATTNKPVDEAFRLSTINTEQIFVLRKLDAGFGFGVVATGSVAVHSEATNTVTIGPILAFGNETTTLTLNPSLEKTFGQNRVEGVAFTYGWQAKHEISKGYAIGIEGYGAVPNIGASPTLAEQPHRIGPVFYYERELTRGPAASGKGMGPKGMDAPAPPKFTLEAGVLFGLTEGTQNTVFKLKSGIEF